MAICFTTACVGVCASGVNVRNVVVDSYLDGKKCDGVSPLRALNHHTHTHTHTHTHLFVPQTGVLCGRHGNSGPPPLSTPSPPLISSSTLHDSPQSVNLELSTCDAIPGTATGGGGEKQEGGRDEERVKQTGWRRRGGPGDEERRRPLSLSLCWLM